MLAISLNDILRLTDRHTNKQLTQNENSLYRIKHLTALFWR